MDLLELEVTREQGDLSEGRQGQDLLVQTEDGGPGLG